ncbi:MAG: DUF4869 domain-containing protein [Lachnospiraceae bacterium]|nr:DUF4869 domain-containing protein [Lachnospiraceae bacterium]
MINIINYKNRQAINTEYKHLKYIDCPWSIFNIVSSALYTNGDAQEVTNIIQQVEGCELINSENFKSKFNGVPLKISSLSTGSQVILCLYYLIKNNQIQDKVINITDCGNNAIKYILQHYNKYNITLYLGHYEIYGDIECNYLLNGKPVDHLYAIGEDR